MIECCCDCFVYCPEKVLWTDWSIYPIDFAKIIVKTDESFDWGENDPVAPCSRDSSLRPHKQNENVKWAVSADLTKPKITESQNICRQNVLYALALFSNSVFFYGEIGNAL